MYYHPMKARPTATRLQRELGFDTIIQLNQKLGTRTEPVLSSGGEGVTSNWDVLNRFREGWRASRHPATVSEMIFTEAEAI